jgi:hypothetical protein
MDLGEGQHEPPSHAGGTVNDTAPRDPLDELRRANPVAADGLPPHSRDRLWSRIEEARMTEPTVSRIPRWTIAASGVVATAALVAAFAVSGSPSPAPTGSDPGSGGGTMMCIQWSVEELQARDFAFDGTVTGISGDQITFAVNDVFWGVDGASITLTGGAGMLSEEGIALDGGPLMVVGDRYLVSGDETFAWTCGFTEVYDEATAAAWAAAAP